MPKHRRIQIRNRQAKRWVTAKMADVKKGDVIRMFEPDGTSVTDSDGQTWLLATSDAWQQDDVWMVHILDIKVNCLG